MYNGEIKVKDGFAPLAAVFAFEYTVICYIVAALIALLSFSAAVSIVFISHLPSANPLRLIIPPTWYSAENVSLFFLSAAGGAVFASGLHFLSNRLEARVMQFSRCEQD
ncbi:hypothetical protein LMG31884_47560 (plasmid) [Xanthomonas hydrangeae]|uniref:hypothetical protein n=1 Tax=Xanthomonas hydrangeae TaxID=2775159 RepID=UPI0019635C2D|nr:hypothetical protein LMG31884_47560 [Xanthomonas hydrangeae]CAD7741326.1 hypothetical protein LMG31884_47560 [Xanthomonas hydrangeae]CAD7747916.1 hypothetical protein LMG31887_46290 [Xanthomonas hydrangeae]CAD7747917.1 hypothetical protein LMG31887_46290 [Xanthomonas hydrangeae]CAD7748206.1 hypothetical protein LMG31885_45200 [Xanthomonas hydrangeae]